MLCRLFTNLMPQFLSLIRLAEFLVLATVSSFIIYSKRLCLPPCEQSRVVIAPVSRQIDMFEAVQHGQGREGRPLTYTHAMGERLILVMRKFALSLYRIAGRGYPRYSFPSHDAGPAALVGSYQDPSLHLYEQHEVRRYYFVGTT